MKVVYSPRYCEVYANDPAAAPGRIEAICDFLEGGYNHQVLGRHVLAFLEGFA